MHGKAACQRALAAAALHRGHGDDRTRHLTASWQPHATNQSAVCYHTTNVLDRINPRPLWGFLPPTRPRERRRWLVPPPATRRRPRLQPPVDLRQASERVAAAAPDDYVLFRD